MIQNIKVDTIYYLTNSDFEMEFNLCGCCKMRLLTDKAESPKSLVSLLARAVSRSQVIICCGKLFDKDGIISVVSQAVKKPLIKINNSDYGIADNGEIEIMEGSVPLVNGDGCFCGCIAESGPQSIIMLTDNKSIRKTVMKSLIHPYIEELSLLLHKSQAAESAETQQTAPETIAETPAEPIAPVIPEVPENTADLTPETEIGENTTDESETEAAGEETAEEGSELAEAQIDDSAEEEAPTETDEVTKEAVEAEEETEVSAEEADTAAEGVKDTANEEKDEPQTEEASLPEVIIDDPNEYATDVENYVDPVEINSGFGLYLEPERVKYSKKSHYSLDYTPSELDNSFISATDEEYFDEEGPDKKILNLPILIVVIILLLALAALCYLLVFVPMNSDYVFSEFIQHIFSVAVSSKII